MNPPGRLIFNSDLPHLRIGPAVPSAVSRAPPADVRSVAPFFLSVYPSFVASLPVLRLTSVPGGPTMARRWGAPTNNVSIGS